MKQLWAPWRMEYISAEKEDGKCIFCRALSVPPEESLLVFSSEHSLVILNKFPYNNGHLLIAPSRHVARLEDLTTEESSEIFNITTRTTSLLTDALSPDGFNIGMNLGSAAGAGIEDHLHMHVVPRWNGDANFMPVLGDVKVIPEHLCKTRERLAELFTTRL